MVAKAKAVAAREKAVKAQQAQQVRTPITLVVCCQTCAPSLRSLSSFYNFLCSIFTCKEYSYVRNIFFFNLTILLK